MEQVVSKIKLQRDRQNRETAKARAELALKEGYEELASHYATPGVRIDHFLGQLYDDPKKAYTLYDAMKYCCGELGMTIKKFKEKNLDQIASLLETACEEKARRELGPKPEPTKWSKPDSPNKWAKVFKCSYNTFMTRLRDGKISHKKLSTKSYQIDMRELPADYKESHSKSQA